MEAFIAHPTHHTIPKLRSSHYDLAAAIKMHTTSCEKQLDEAWKANLSKFLSMKDFGKRLPIKKMKPSADVNVLLVNHQEITHAARE